MPKPKSSKRLALLIGINYEGSSAQLNGCINDVQKMKQFLVNNCNYKESDIVLLTDDTKTKPTAVNIMREIGKLIVSAYYNKSDEIFIHYSGHGTSIVDRDGDEDDNRDEALVPLDYQTSGLISDDLLHDYFSYLPETCKCVCLFDCCHSGTILDLKYRYVKEETSVVENPKSDVEGNVIMISGCRDVQTSADAYIKGNWAGAMTSAFLDTMDKFDYNVTCFHLLSHMRQYLEDNNYEQVPQICSSNKLSNVSIFSLNQAMTPYFICHK